MNNKFVYPNYNRSILGIPNSLLRYYGAKTHHPSLPMLDQYLGRDYQNVILIILDGMGVDMMKHNLSCLSFLRRHIRMQITSVFPSTTVAATTAYYSGLSPIEHGWLGWSPYFQDLKRVVELYTNRDYYTNEPQDKPVTRKMGYCNICDQIVAADRDVKCTKIFPTFVDPAGPTDFDEFCLRIKQASQNPGRQFVLAYWPEPDHTSHDFGPHSPEVYRVLKDQNAKIKKMCADLKDSLVIISADHGHTETQDTPINDYPEMMDCLAAPLSLDMRVKAVFLKPKRDREFVRLFHQYLAKDFMLIKTTEALKMKLFGPGKPHPYARGFLGDYLILSKGHKCLVQRFPNDCHHALKGGHSGLTAPEMIVPLIVIEKK